VLDSYRYVERAIKYGILFLALVFTAFFLFEVRLLTRMHPLQYTLVGAALCLFYLAVLSLSEFIPFGWAYLAGSAAAITLLGLQRLDSRRSPARMARRRGPRRHLRLPLCPPATAEYSLLYGTGALFLALAVVMYATAAWTGTPATGMTRRRCRWGGPGAARRAFGQLAWSRTKPGRAAQWALPLLPSGLKRRAVDHAQYERGEPVIVPLQRFHDPVHRALVIILQPPTQRVSQQLGSKATQELLATGGEQDRFSSAGPWNASPLASWPDGSIACSPSFSRHVPMPSKFSKPKPMGP
jgi:hypothetical protein